MKHEAMKHPRQKVTGFALFAEIEFMLYCVLEAVRAKYHRT